MDIAMLILTIISTVVACASLILSFFIKKDVNSIKKNKVKQIVNGNDNNINGVIENSNVRNSWYERYQTDKQRK